METSFDTDRDDEGRLQQYHGATAHPGCVNCPCAVNGQANPKVAVPAFGARKSLAIVGEGPSTEEIQQKYPFVGPSGRVLNRVFEKYGIDRQLLWITNALICPRPRDEALVPKAVECCRPRLQAELAWVQPEAVIALGRTAIEALQLEATSIADARGAVQASPLLPNVPVFSSIHPAAILRGGAGEGVAGGSQKMNMDTQMLFLEADIAKAHNVALKRTPATWSDDVMVYIDPAPIQMPRFALPPQAPAPVQQPVPAPVPPVAPIAPEAPVDPREEPTQPGVLPPPSPARAEQSSRQLSIADEVQANVAAVLTPLAPIVAPPPDAAMEAQLAHVMQAHPDILLTLRALAGRVRNTDLFIELVSIAVEDASQQPAQGQT